VLWISFYIFLQQLRLFSMCIFCITYLICYTESIISKQTRMKNSKLASSIVYQAKSGAIELRGDAVQETV